MSEASLNDIVSRLEALERAVGIQPRNSSEPKWKRVVGMFAGSDFMKQVDEEGQKIRETERAEAQQGSTAE